MRNSFVSTGVTVADAARTTQHERWWALALEAGVVRTYDLIREAEVRAATATARS